MLQFALLSTGVSHEMADDDKHFTTAVYGNGPGYQIVNGTRPDMNESVSCKYMLLINSTT